MSCYGGLQTLGTDHTRRNKNIPEQWVHTHTQEEGRVCVCYLMGGVWLLSALMPTEVSAHVNNLFCTFSCFTSFYCHLFILFHRTERRRDAGTGTASCSRHRKAINNDLSSGIRMAPTCFHGSTPPRLFIAAGRELRRMPDIWILDILDSGLGCRGSVW